MIDTVGSFYMCDHVTGFINYSGNLFGATVGRVANRTYPADFLFNREYVSLSRNSGDIHLHGGINGFDMVILRRKFEFIQIFTLCLLL